jgi:hypothetical protein
VGLLLWPGPWGRLRLVKEQARDVGGSKAVGAARAEVVGEGEGAGCGAFAAAGAAWAEVPGEKKMARQAELLLRSVSGPWQRRRSAKGLA